MANEVEMITDIEFEDRSYKVEDMDETVRALVNRYNEWRVEQKRCADELVMREYASRSLASEVMMLARKYLEENPDTAYTEVKRPAPVEESSAIDEALAEGDATPEDLSEDGIIADCDDGC